MTRNTKEPGDMRARFGPRQAAARTTLCLLTVAMFLAPALKADDALIPGELVVDPPTLICLGFYWPMQGDDNRNAVCTIDFRKKGETTWRHGLPLWRAYDQIVGDDRMVAIRKTGNYFAGSIFNLTPDTLSTSWPMAPQSAQSCFRLPVTER